MYRSALLALAAILELIFFPVAALAQDHSFDVGYSFAVNDADAQTGDIVISTSQGLTLTETSYSNKLFGVIQSQPILVFKSKSSAGRPIARSGVTEVNVTTLNGSIKQNDYITSSEIKGKGAKAAQSGYVIGIALTDFNEEGATKMEFQNRTILSGKVLVALKIEYAEITTARSALSLFQQANLAFLGSVTDPEKFTYIFRYIVAGFTVIVAFGVGFFTFSRSIPKSVEAIGRNPLAEKAILFSIILNIFFTVATASIGIIAALIILKL